MHIAFWSPAWPLEKFHNGIVTYVHWMKHDLERRGHRVSVFTSEMDPSVSDPRVYPVGRSLADRLLLRVLPPRRAAAHRIFNFSSAIAAAMAGLHRREPIDLIEMEESFGWCREVARRTALPMVVKLHGPAFMSMLEEELSTPFGRDKVEREGEALRMTPAIASPAQTTLDQTIARYGLQPRLQRHLVNPMTLPAAAPLWARAASDPDTILFVGRFDRRKGGDLVLQAFARLVSGGRRARLIFVGPDSGIPGADGTVSHFQAYCESVIPAASRPLVEYRGRMSNAEIAKLRAQAAVTVVASRWENQGYTLLEAMLQGCPVVSSDAGGNPESIIDGRTGLLAAAGDAEALAAKLGAMLGDPDRAARLGETARRHVLEVHSAERVTTETLDFYRAVIDDHARRRERRAPADPT